MDIITYILAKKYTDKVVKSSGGVIVDSSLSSTSTNPVQNKIITQKIKEILNKLVSDSTLSVSGGFADAKVVGDNLSSLDDRISKIESMLPTLSQEDSGKYIKVGDDGSLKAQSINKIGDITQE